MGEINLTEEQFFDLIVKGICDINGFKVTALFEGKLFDSNIMRHIKEEAILRSDYKQKVKEVIDKILFCSTKNLDKGYQCTDEECLNCCKNKELKRALGLE